LWHHYEVARDIPSAPSINDIFTLIDRGGEESLAEVRSMIAFFKSCPVGLNPPTPGTPPCTTTKQQLMFNAIKTFTRTVSVGTFHAPFDAPVEMVPFGAHR
jgi:hypothetical protein